MTRKLMEWEIKGLENTRHLVRDLQMWAEDEGGTLGDYGARPQVAEAAGRLVACLAALSDEIEADGDAREGRS